MKPTDYFYDAVLSLSSRQIINGYNEVTFNPYANVTRAQAAKILALSLDLDLENIVDPGFKDVPKSNNFYKYIAALANENIISGNNGKFSPNDLLKRSHMAKILSLGFQLKNEPLKSNPFKDVGSGEWYAEYITPLLKHKITSGTTDTTISPNKLVSRGQLAAFVYRVESATEDSIVMTSSIVGFTDDKIILKNGEFNLPETATKWLNTSNQYVLNGANLVFYAENGIITSIKSI